MCDLNCKYQFVTTCMPSSLKLKSKNFNEDPISSQTLLNEKRPYKRSIRTTELKRLGDV